MVMSVVALRPVARGQEVLVNYNYALHLARNSLKINKLDEFLGNTPSFPGARLVPRPVLPPPSLRGGPLRRVRLRRGQASLEGGRGGARQGAAAGEDGPGEVPALRRVRGTRGLRLLQRQVRDSAILDPMCMLHHFEMAVPTTVC